MPIRTHQVVIGLMAVIFVVICALVSTMHQQYRFLAAAGNNTADSPLAGNAGDGAEGMLDLNAPGIRPQLTLLLHNLTPGTPVPVAVVPPGASVAEARMITLAPCAIHPSRRLDGPPCHWRRDANSGWADDPALSAALFFRSAECACGVHQQL